MTNRTIGNALIILRPGASWNLSGNTLAGLVWLDTIQTRPTDEEIIAQIALQG
jgi:hypothetical protein